MEALLLHIPLNNLMIETFMILLDFRIIEEELNFNLAENPFAARSPSFIYTFFFMPVRFQIDDIEVFEFKDLQPVDCWIEIPLLEFATACEYTLREAKKYKHSEYEIPEDWGEFKFEMVDETKIKFTYKYNNIELILDYNELWMAFKNFEERVEYLLMENCRKCEKILFGALGSEVIPIINLSTTK